MRTAFNSQKRQLLRGRLSRSNAIRPPWSIDEADFVDRCSRCRRCVEHCPEQILQIGSGGFPEVNFSLGECTFCADCVSACDEPLFTSTQHKPWNHKATISDRCLVTQSVVCRSCAEQCEPEAIRFKLQPGGLAMPAVDLSRCNGCGACVPVCPTQAVTVTVTHAAPADSTPIIVSNNGAK